MKESGLTARETARGSKSGLMDHDMRVSGVMVRQMGTASCTTLMVISTRETGWMIRPMGMALTPTQTGQSTLVSGKTTSSMALVSRLGPMALCTKVPTLKERRMERENLLSQMVQSTRESSR